MQIIIKYNSDCSFPDIIRFKNRTILHLQSLSCNNDNYCHFVSNDKIGMLYADSYS